MMPDPVLPFATVAAPSALRGILCNAVELVTIVSSIPYIVVAPA
jgi:hypothetical protein